ncbi:MAG: glutamate--tRNA ligase [Patescibacteria group bacterium]|nr:glutamate--tRNA ligase [Patescibacteria group bacterium]
MAEVRTRFAPSPTGYLHVGSLRTVLFAYLIAKSLAGKLILRIEDTDQSRKVAGAEKKMIKILDWLGFKFDEGPALIAQAKKDIGDYGPYVQSQRSLIYQKYANELIDKGEAYYCFCSAERLAKMRSEQQAEKMPPRYDRRCRYLDKKEIKERLANNEKYVIRQKLPLEGEVIVNDVLRGKIKFRAEDLEDQILLKSDGMPTYHLAVVVDDHLMKISHVVRGEEWIPSFPKNILLYQAFDWQPPVFIHLPLTLNKGGGKLSKRQGDTAVEDYRDKGYLPAALINFSALLGWRPKHDKEIFSLKQLIKEFKIKDIGTSPAVFDIEKLDYLNGYFIRQMDIEKLVELCRPYLKNISGQTSEYIKSVIALEQERLKKISDIAGLIDFFFLDKLDYPKELLIWKKLTLDQATANMNNLYKILVEIPDKKWNKEKLEKIILKYLNKNNLKTGEYLWPLRVALTGRKASPGPFEVASILGKEKSLDRINQASKQ